MVQSRERIEAAMALDMVDRPAFSLWGHKYLKEWSPNELAEATIQEQKKFLWDLIKFQPRATCFAEALGNVYRPSGQYNKAPIPEKVIVNEPSDWSRVDVPTLAEAGSLLDQVLAIETVASHFKGTVPVIQTIFSPLTVAGYLVNQDHEKLYAHLKAQKNTIKGLLNRIADLLVEFASSSIDHGADGIFFAISGYASKNELDYDEYLTEIAPFDEKVLSAIGEHMIKVLHLCGSNVYMELARKFSCNIVSYDNFLEGNPQLKAAIEFTGKAVMGGIDRENALLKGTPEDVMLQATNSIKETGGKGLIVAAGCSISPEVTDENKFALQRVVMQYSIT